MRDERRLAFLAGWNARGRAAAGSTEHQWSNNVETPKFRDEAYQQFAVRRDQLRVEIRKRPWRKRQ